MRVALVCPYDLRRPGGVQGQVTGLAAATAVAGVPVLVVAPGERAGAHPVGAEVSPGGDRTADGGAASGPVTVTVGRSLPVPANGSVAPLALGPLAWARTVTALRRWRPDVVHVHEPLAPVVGWAAVTAPVPGAVRVGTVHRSGGDALYRLAAPLGRLAMGRLDAVFAVSEAARTTAAAVLGHRPCPVVGNGVDVDRLAAADPAPTEGPTVLFVGRHEPRKGLGLLLGAVDSLGPRWPGRLWIVGEGPQTDELRRRYPPGPTRRWCGRVTDDELASLLRGAQVCCFPSLGGESFGVVLVEAMAAGCVVVCSDIPGYTAVLDGHGLTFPPGDQAGLAAAVAAAVTAVVEGSGPAAPPALAAARCHAASYAMTTLAARYLDTYRQLVAARRPPG